MQGYWCRYRKIGLLIAMFSSLNLVAQQGAVVGLGPTYEIDEQLFGINTRFFYGKNERFCFGPELSFFPFQDIDLENEVSILDLNLNAHYIFELNDKTGVYPLSGINYTIESEREILFPEESEREKAFGLNYGVGAHYNLKNVFVFIEFKGIVGQLSDEFLTIGVLFKLSKTESE